MDFHNSSKERNLLKKKKKPCCWILTRVIAAKLENYTDAIWGNKT